MKMRDRVIAAAEAVLQREGAVGPLELLQQIGFLHFSHVQQWRKGNEYFSDLESHIQCGEKKLAETWRHFLEWVHDKKLEPVEASYAGASRFGAEPLQISIDGDPQREEFFRTQYRPADLSRAKKQRLEKKLNKAPDLTIFQLTSDRSECSECGVELLRGELLFLEKQQPLCLTCADMDHLEILPSGNTALTRRTRKHSPLVAMSSSSTDRESVTSGKASYGAIYGALIALLVVLIFDVVTAPGITPDDSGTWIEPYRYYLYVGIILIGIWLGVGRARRRDDIKGWTLYVATNRRSLV